MKKNLLFLIIIIIGIIFAHKIKAEVSLSISPQKLELILFPGDVFEGKFKITNQSEIAIPISIKTIPFSAREGSGEMEFEKIEKDSPVFWFYFEKKDLILGPHETKRIDFKIEVPKEARIGGYYVFVYFEPRFPKDYFDGSGPKVIPILGVPILISTSEVLLEPPTGKEAEVLSFSIPEEERIKFLENSFKFTYEKAVLSLATIGIVEAAKSPQIFVSKSIPSSFLITIKNNDVYHLKPIGKIFVFDIFGKKIGEGELKGETILPGKKRDFEVRLNQKENFSLGQILSFVLFGKTKTKLEVKFQSPIRGEFFLPKTDFSLTFYSLKSIYFGVFFVIIILLLFLARNRIWLFFKFLFFGKKT